MARKSRSKSPVSQVSSSVPPSGLTESSKAIAPLFDIPHTSWKSAWLLFVFFFCFGLIVYFVSGQAADTVYVYCSVPQPDEGTGCRIAIETPWGQGFEQLLFEGENRVGGRFFSRIVLCCSERPPIPLQIVLLPSIMPGAVDVKPDDWVSVSGIFVYDLSRGLPQRRPFGPLGESVFPKPVLNWSGVGWMVTAAVGYWPFWLLLPLALLVVEERRHQDAAAVKRKELAILLVGTFFFTIFVEVLFNRYLIQILRPDIPALVAEAMKTFIYVDRMQPNPSLIVRYTLSIAVLPFLLTVGYALSQTLLNRFRRSEYGLDRAFLVAILLGIVFPLLMLESWISDIRYFVILVLGRVSAAIVLVVAVWWLCSNVQQARRLLTPLGSVLIVVFLAHVFLLRLHRESFPPEPLHFDCVYYSVTQLMVGKTPFVDVDSLYGGFAVFLEPFLRIIGYGVFPFMFLMSVLSVLSLLFLFLALRLIVRDRLLLVFGGLYLFFYVYVFQYFWNGALPGKVMYSQQAYLMRFPLRTLTVFAALFLMLLYFKRRSPSIYWTILSLVFLAPFWNLDTGVILPIVWILSVFVDEYLRRPSLGEFVRTACRHLGVFVAFAIFVPLLFSLDLFLRSGHWPDYLRMSRFLRSHAVAGFFAVPMAERHLSLLVLLIFALGLSYVLYCLIKKRNEYSVRIVCVLSLFGFGLFPYFVNRSQMMNLFIVSFTAPMLVLFVLSRLRRGFQRDVRARRLTVAVAGYSALLGLFLCSLSFCVEMTPDCLEASWTNFRLLTVPNDNYTPIPVERVQPHSVALECANIAFVRRLTDPGESVLFLSENVDALYHGTSKTRAVLDLPSTVEWSRHDEMARLIEFLEKNETTKVFVELGNVPPFTLNPEIANKIAELMNERYEIIDRAAAPGTIVLVRKKAGENKIIPSPSP